MKTALFLPGLVAVFLGQAGCYVPLSSKVISEKEIGSRTEATPIAKAGIVHRVVRQPIISPLETLSDKNPATTTLNGINIT